MHDFMQNSLTDGDKLTKCELSLALEGGSTNGFFFRDRARARMAMATQISFNGAVNSTISICQQELRKYLIF